jgi:diguanylate cyclase
MLNEQPIGLDLRVRSAQPNESQKAFIDQLLLLLKDALTDGPTNAPAELPAEIETMRTSLAAGQDIATIATLGAHCLDACRAAVAQLGEERLERQKEVRSLLELMREALASVAAGTDTLQVDLAKSADRFSALARIEDPKELKARLQVEVASLKHLAVDCRTAWQGTVSKLDERVTSLETQLKTITVEASIDPLTGIANRRAFERTCRNWMTTSPAQFILAILDVDKFKPINDNYGHSTGDRLLVYVARTLASSLRTEDLVARLGGDEFVVLASNLTLRTAEARMARILSVFSAQEDLGDDKFPVGISMSCGIAEFSAGDTLESLLKRADEALYDAKRQGRGRAISRAVPFLRDLLKRRF